MEPRAGYFSLYNRLCRLYCINFRFFILPKLNYNIQQNVTIFTPFCVMFGQLTNLYRVTIVERERAKRGVDSGIDGETDRGINGLVFRNERKRQKEE